ncbi:spindle pole body component 110-like [Hibiscus syriacus]|uniref:spindle pole body component 110-like n=1 Tax=Hibiscus syriacus TaxID=106335 RepID=UPI0019223F1B|nr:spindle pole body component 110-like [Hibiscus syriacus]
MARAAATMLWFWIVIILMELLPLLRKENELHVQKEATLQERIQHLQHENESHRQKEATLEETIKQLRNEFDSHLKKEVFLEETIQNLQHRNDSHLRKEASLEEAIQQLQHESGSQMQKVASLGMNVVGLQNEKESWFQEKASFEEKISHLLDEKAALDLKWANLEENVRQLEKENWILTENSTKQSISSLNRDITRLKMQVIELEESKSKLSRENQQLTENISSMQLHIQNLKRNILSVPPFEGNNKQGSGYEDLKSQIEAASVLVEKLVMENAELVEKVNELYVKLDQQSKAGGHSKVIEMPNSVPQFLENGSILYPKLDSAEASPITNGEIEHENVDEQPTAPLPRNVESEDSGEIVQIPLDDTDVRNLESRGSVGEENAVPLTDAPLIGAPFRLVSFVARYVSGADLVNNT